MSALLMLVHLAAHAVEPSPAFDHAYTSFGAAIQGAVDATGVRYDVLRSRRALLDAHLAAVAAADPSAFTREQALAFWVNAYNGYTLATVLDAWPLKSIRDLDGGKVWSTRTFLVAGQRVTLDEMEHGHARTLADGRVHAVVSCASKGCPPLPSSPLVAADLDAQLDAHARRWVATNAWSADGSTLRVSRIFEWYAGDFVRWRGVDHPGATDAQDAAIGFLRAFGLPAAATWTRVDYVPYDWSLNAR